ncbi:MAG: hypothetical protein IJ193_03050, partial [Bacilli bacterium]|nr:hypothetical protein [Bacilli bacterium]
QIYYSEHLKTKDKYSYFLDGNHALIVIDNKERNDGSSIVIIKNSYANCFIPYLIPHYDKIHVIDLRYYNYNVTNYITDHQFQDKLILYNLNNYYSDLSIIKLK